MRYIKRVFLFLFSMVLYVSLSYSADSFYVITMPKAGTNIITKLIKSILIVKKINIHRYGTVYYAIPDDPLNGYHISHLFALERYQKIVSDNNHKAVFLVRDLRDQLVSFAYYIKKHCQSNSEHPLYKLANLPMDQMLTHMIEDAHFMNGWIRPRFHVPLQAIDTFYHLYLPWIDHPLVYTTSFEKLVGAKGGGDDELRIREIMNIGAHLGIHLSRNEAVRVSKLTIFGLSETFRKGQIGAWKEEFNDHHKELFKKHAGDLLISLGYEENLDW